MNIQKPDILKSAAIVIQNRKFLMTREHGENFLSVLGGSIKNNEDPIDCLKREVEEEIGVKDITIASKEPFYTTPLAPAGSQPDKLLQMLCYFVTLHKEPHTTYNPKNPIEGEDIEEICWVGGDDLQLVEKPDGSFIVKYKDNPRSITLTHATEDYLIPKLIELGLLDKPDKR